MPISLLISIIKRCLLNYIWISNVLTRILRNICMFNVIFNRIMNSFEAWICDNTQSQLVAWYINIFIRVVSAVNEAASNVDHWCNIIIYYNIQVFHYLEKNPTCILTTEPKQSQLVREGWTNVAKTVSFTYLLENVLN